MVTYIGIIDTEGLDRFEPLTNKSGFVCELRAQCNPQRHACTFLVDFEDCAEPSKEIKKCKNVWQMWNWIQVNGINLRCKPEDAKTIKNIKKLARAIQECVA